ncbi:hypothetical protein TNCV_2106871 [Trichonephila clavipes]|nr:hypothetical protein TNCV_2106871 [Trichonephila clavipes]
MCHCKLQKKKEQQSHFTLEKKGFANSLATNKIRLLRFHFKSKLFALNIVTLRKERSVYQAVIDWPLKDHVTQNELSDWMGPFFNSTVHRTPFFLALIFLLRFTLVNREETMMEKRKLGGKQR